MSVMEIEFSVRTMNSLENANIQTIGELIQKTEADLLKLKNFGRKSLKEINDVLSDMGLRLGMGMGGSTIPSPPPAGMPAPVTEEEFD